MSAEKTAKTVGKPKNTHETPAADTGEAPAPKKPLSWKEKLALLPEDEAKAMRTKAAEASRRSKAKKRGTSPEKAAVDRITVKLAKIEEEQTILNIHRQALQEELEAAMAALTAAEAEKETTNEQA